MNNTFSYAVIFNGKYYPANTPVPIENETPKIQTETPESETETPESEKAAKNGNKRAGRKPKS